MNTYYNDESTLGEQTLEFLATILGSTDFWLGVMVTVFVVLVVIWRKRK